MIDHPAGETVVEERELVELRERCTTLMREAEEQRRITLSLQKAIDVFRHEFDPAPPAHISPVRPSEPGNRCNRCTQSRHAEVHRTSRVVLAESAGLRAA
ncbi:MULTISPECIES: hypothetical protein [Streptosporangium]|uniref:Uncharacterized protein n=1 Tax=Streptosporangium brasiliense TaxID=47480 RepID=A0ABT9RMG8_9ACTN|nr:hypothetical protein [Streptosporangium brasiliense]MDP9870263.1 hypothetical protein [Streptosporangium brasiliense]